MADTRPPKPPYSCRVTGEPFVRSITLRDGTPLEDSDPPVQITARVYFDGAAPDVAIHSITLEAGPGQPLIVTLYVAPEDVAAPFTDKTGVHVPPAIAGRIFLTPPCEGDDDDVRPWELVELPDPHDPHTVREWVACPVYVAEVRVR